MLLCYCEGECTFTLTTKQSLLSECDFGLFDLDSLKVQYQCTKFSFASLSVVELVDHLALINEHREYFLGVKSSRCVRLTTLPPSCAIVTKSGNLNFLEPSGPVQACNGTALPCLTFFFEVGIRKVLRLATSTQVFLGFPMSLSKC
jgi:hypothetical protein